MQKTVAKINLKNIQQNARVFRAISKTKLCAVVKADAYGHGAEEITAALSGVADCFAVALIEEGISIREYTGGKDILVLTPPTNLEEAFQILTNGFIATVSGEKCADLLIKAAETYNLCCRVHIKVNLGMNRYGVKRVALKRLCKRLKRANLSVEGFYGHLHIHTKDAAKRCKDEFLKGRETVLKVFPNICCHLASTYGACLGREYSFDMVRIGIGLYGYLAEPPLSVEEERIEKRLKKGMQVYAKVVSVRRSGKYAGYGENAFVTGKYLSTLRVGYADGFLRKRENGTHGGERNANDFCMDACIRNGKYRVGEYLAVMTDASETALKTGTIPYEVLCASSRRAKLVYVYE